MNLPPGIDSKFRMILVVAKRARQLQAGAKPLLQTNSKKPTRVAQQEVSSGLIPLEIQEEEADGGLPKVRVEGRKPESRPARRVLEYLLSEASGFPVPAE